MDTMDWRLLSRTYRNNAIDWELQITHVNTRRINDQQEQSKGLTVIILIWSRGIDLLVLSLREIIIGSLIGSNGRLMSGTVVYDSGYVTHYSDKDRHRCMKVHTREFPRMLLYKRWFIILSWDVFLVCTDEEICDMSHGIKPAEWKD